MDQFLYRVVYEVEMKTFRSKNSVRGKTKRGRREKKKRREEM